jgi:hypothetical protein
MTGQLETQRARSDEYSSKFFPQSETKVINPVGGRNATEGDAH